MYMYRCGKGLRPRPYTMKRLNCDVQSSNRNLFLLVPCEALKKQITAVIKYEVLFQAMHVRKDAPKIVFSSNLFGQNRPQIHLSFLEKLNPLQKLFTYAHWIACILNQLINTCYFSHFHATTVILANFTVKCA